MEAVLVCHTAVGRGRLGGPLIPTEPLPVPAAGLAEKGYTPSSSKSSIDFRRSYYADLIYTFLKMIPSTTNNHFGWPVIPKQASQVVQW